MASDLELWIQNTPGKSGGKKFQTPKAQRVEFSRIH
jgi:hypothetical protein